MFCDAVQIDGRGKAVSDYCFITSAFAEFCEATVRCRFTQTEFRPAVVDICGSDYDRALMTFGYKCLPGTRSLALVLLKYMCSPFAILWLKMLCPRVIRHTITHSDGNVTAARRSVNHNFDEKITCSLEPPV